VTMRHVREDTNQIYNVCRRSTKVVKSLSVFIFFSIQFLCAEVGCIVLVLAVIPMSCCAIGASPHCQFLLEAGCI
jgi:hypothetical protein